jgi:hypothetical protein
MGITISKIRSDSDRCRNQNISRRINTTVHIISRRKPLKGTLVVFYNSLYNTFFHRGIQKLTGEWADLVGSYIEDTCVSSSDIDFINLFLNAFTDPKHIPVDYKNALLIITDKEEIPPGSCWLRLYDTLKGDRYGDPVLNRNGLEWFYHCDEYSPLDMAHYVCKVKEFDGHSHFPYTSALNKIPCLRPAIVENNDGYRYFSRAKTEEYFGKRGFTLLAFVNRFLPKFLDNGPAFKQKYFGCFDIDVVYAINCESGWPDSAQEWTNRTRNWPERSIVEDICRSGFQVVPIGSKLQLSTGQDLE